MYEASSLMAQWHCAKTTITRLSSCARLTRDGEAASIKPFLTCLRN